MVTFYDMFMFTMVIISVVNLVVIIITSINNTKK